MRRCGEADLVVDDEVHGAASAVPTQTRKRKAFRHHALPRERGVAMNEQRHHPCAQRVQSFSVFRPGRALGLLGARLAEHDGVDDFEVRWVGGDRGISSGSVRTARDILDERYARGEIDREEYQKRRLDISGA